tara:strand:- start:138 stop:1235 length:1098 start_codon:yes stop_codon:yes gene_type:complete
MILDDTFKGKTVLITGHTGFKGTWLTAWLNKLGAKVIGISLGVNTSPSHFDSVKNLNDVEDLILDIRERQSLKEVVDEAQPDFTFHLAAQALVRDSYVNPVDTLETNSIGTLNLLESLRELDKKSTAIFITSDKCYNNKEWVWGYKEDDELGGPDPYSASKGVAELIIRSYVKSFFPQDSTKVRIASARAGNVIGGGDWSKDRIVPDIIKAWQKNITVELRSPHSTRPWQHVLEPLSGYLNLAQRLNEDINLHGESFNFGPLAQQNYSVSDLVNSMSKQLKGLTWKDISSLDQGPYESELLKLNCDKALALLEWHSVMDFDKTVGFTTEWYNEFYKDNQKAAEVTSKQIDKFCELAKQQKIKWSV